MASIDRALVSLLASRRSDLILSIVPSPSCPFLCPPHLSVPSCPGLKSLLLMWDIVYPPLLIRANHPACMLLHSTAEALKQPGLP